MNLSAYIDLARRAVLELERIRGLLEQLLEKETK